MRFVIILIISALLMSCGKKPDTTKIPQETTQPRTAPPSPDSLTTNKQAPITGSTDATTSPLETSQEVSPLLKKPKTEAPTILNKHWNLVTLDGETIKLTDNFRSPPYITFSLRTDKMTGSGGCNRFGCKFLLNGNKLSFSGFAATKLTCKDAMDVEKPFLEELAAVTGYRLEGNTMWLLRNDKRVMKFETESSN